MVVGAARGTYARAVTPGGVYGADREIAVAVHFGYNVSFSGAAPELALNVSGSPRTAEYKSGNGTAALVFGYVVRPGDYTGDLDYHTPRALTGNLVNGTGQPVDRALFAPGAVGSLSSISDILIDSAAPPLIAAGRADDGKDGFGALDLAVDVDAIAVDGRTYAVVSAAGDNAVQLIRVHGNGTLEAKDEERDSARLAHAHDVDAFYMGGAAYAIAAAHVNSSVHLLRIHGDSGTLSAAGSLYDNSTLELLGVTGITAFEMGGGTYALAAGHSDDGVQLVRINGDGSLEAAGWLRDNSTLALDGPFDSAVFDLGGEKHALVTGHADDGVELVRINGDGSLEAVSRLRDNGTLALDGPRGVAAFDLGGTMHALVASTVDDGVQLVRIGADGTLSAAGSASDGDPGFAELDGASGVSAFAGDDGAVHALVASRDDDGVQLVRIGADGALLPAGWAPDGERGFGLEDAGGTAAFSMNGHRHALVSLIEGDGVQLVRMSAASVDNVTSAAANGTYTQGDEIDIAVAFSRPVNVSGAVELRLNSGGAAEYRSGNGTAELAFRYEVQAGDFAADLDYAGAGALSGGGSITDTLPDLLVGRALPAAGTGRSLGDLKDILVDASPPEAASVSSPNATGTYGIGSAIAVNVTFDEPVTVTGGPPAVNIRLNSTATRTAEYSSGNGTQSLLFIYTVAQGDGSDGLAHAGTPLVLNGSTIRDAAGNDASTALPAPGASLRADGDIGVDGLPPGAESVSSPDAAGPHGIGRTIRVDVNFTEPVTVAGDGRPFVVLATGGASNGSAAYASGNGTKSLRFEYEVREGDDAPRLAHANSSALFLNGSTVRDGAGNGARTTLPEPSGSLLAGGQIAVDGVRPGVETVSTPNQTGTTYYTNQRLHIHANFGESVTVRGGQPALSLALDAGDGARAAYHAGNGTDALVFAYDVRRDDAADALDYAGEAALDLGGATIRDAAGNDARPGLPPPGPQGSPLAAARIAVDGTVVSVAGVTSPDDDGAYGAGARVNITVTFTEAVDVSSGATPPPSIALNAGEGARAAYRSGSGTGTLLFAYEVRPGDNAGRLAYSGGSALSPGGAAIAATDGGAPAHLDLPVPGRDASLSGSKAIAIDTAPPSVERVYSPNRTGAYETGDTVHIVVAFDEDVAVAGTPVLGLETGETDRNAAYASGSGTASLLFLYTVAAGDLSADLDYANASALRLAGGSIADLAGNAADLALPAPGSAGSSLAGTSGIEVRGGPGPGGGGGPGPGGGGGPGPGVADTCAASLSPSAIPFGSVKAGGRSAAEAQAVRSAGTLPIAEVSVSAANWTDGSGRTVMAASATSARAASGGSGEWSPLGSGPVVVQADAGGRSASVEFVLDVPQGALQLGAPDAPVSQVVTYTVTCGAPPG